MQPVVRAKVKCSSVKEQDNTYYKEVDGKYVANVVRSWSYEFKFAGGHESAENKRFWDASPSGSLNLSVVKDNLYEVGQWYYIDFTPTTVEGT
jgi:hypothetical protein